MKQFIAHQIVELGWLIFPLIALLILLEGEAVIYSVMFLSFQGSLNLYAAVITICCAVALTDISSYAFGYYGKIFFPRIAKFYEKIIHPLDGRLQKMSFSVFLISKFTYGLHRAVMIRSGMLELPIKKFFRINLITNIIWIITISCLAFGSWKSIHFFEETLRYAEVFMLIFVVLLLIGSHIFSFYSNRKLLAEKQ